MKRVSVVVPTLNSAATLSLCLESVRNQSVEDLEIIIVDSLSHDSTPAIAERFGRLIREACGATKARLIGANAATGDYVLNLDSDQALNPRTIERCLEVHSKAVVLGEISVGKGVIARINKLEKAVTHQLWKENLMLNLGPLRPRFYDRGILLEAYRRIPAEILEIQPSAFSEDLLLFEESGIARGDIGYVPDAILHFEEERVWQYLRKWYLRGKIAKRYRGTRFEHLIFSGRNRAVSGPELVACFPSILARGIPLLLGYSL